MDPERRRALLAQKLAALVRDHERAGGATAVAGTVPGTFAGGAALVAGDTAWVLADERPERALGPALAWARAQRATDLHLLAEAGTGLLARRAAEFATPPTVLFVAGRDLLPAVAEPLAEPPAVDPRLEPLRDVIAAGGALPVVEHGVLGGEVAGLEVCRAVVDPDVDVVRLEVGVGAHDREAFLLVHGDVPPSEALATVVARVREARRPGAEPHPLNRLGKERVLRERLVAEPGRVGAATLAAVPPPVPRPNLKDPVPCVAAGTDGDGAPVVVVCSVGIDLDLVPFAADARLATAPDGRLVLAVPERDAHPVTRALAAALRRPAEVVPV